MKRFPSATNAKFGEDGTIQKEESAVLLTKHLY